MNCREVRELLLDFYHGVLPEGPSEEVALHLRECSRCFSAWRALEGALQALGALPMLPTPEELRPSVLARAQSILEGAVGDETASLVRPRPPAGRLRTALLAGGVVAGLALLSFLIGLAVSGPKGERLPHPAFQPKAGAGAHSPLATGQRGRPRGARLTPSDRASLEREASPELAPPMEPKGKEIEGASPKLFLPPAPALSKGLILSVSVRPGLPPSPGGRLTITVEFSRPVEWTTFSSGEEGLLAVEKVRSEGRRVSLRLALEGEGPWTGRLTAMVGGMEFDWLMVLPSAAPAAKLGEEALSAVETAEAVASRAGLPLLVEGRLVMEKWEPGPPPESPVALAEALGGRARRVGDAWLIESGWR